MTMDEEFLMISGIQHFKVFLNNWQEKKREVIMHPFLEEKISWCLVPYVQSLLLARSIRGDIEVAPHTGCVD